MSPIGRRQARCARDLALRSITAEDRDSIGEWEYLQVAEPEDEFDPAARRFSHVPMRHSRFGLFRQTRLHARQALRDPLEIDIDVPRRACPEERGDGWLYPSGCQ